MDNQNKRTAVMDIWIFIATGFILVSIHTGVEGRFRTPDDVDILTDVGTSVRCSKSKLSVSKAEALYTWEVDGLLNYLRFLKDFGAGEFRHSTENIVYDSEQINGEWLFELRSTGEKNFIKATYTYQETKENLNGNFGVKLKILQPNSDVLQMPLLRPTKTFREQIFTRKKGKGGNKPKKGASFIFSYSSSEEDDTDTEGIMSVIQIFEWPELSTEKLVQFFQQPNPDLIFTFMIQVYFPAEAKTFKKITCSLDQLENKYILGAIKDRNVTTNILPYDRNANDTEIFCGPHHRKERIGVVYNATAMFAEAKFADLIVQVEETKLLVHSAILYYSSPLLASLVLNATGKFSQKTSTNPETLPVLHFPNELGVNGTIELLRYIYTGKVDRLVELASKIIIGAERFNLHELKIMCEQSLITQVNLDNVISLYSLGLDVSSSQLIRKAFAIIQVNRANIVSQSEEFKKLSVKYPNLMFELFIS